MKHNIYTIVIMLATIVFVSQSCKKEDAVVQQQDSNNTAILGAQGGGMDDTEAKIVKFFNRMSLVRKDPNYSGSENWNYTADSTIWYIEAALNYKYSYNWQYSGNETHSDLYNTDSSFTTVNSNNGEEYNILALQVSYDALAEELETQYSNIDDNNKFFVLSDIVKLGNENGNLQLLQYSVIGMANQAIQVSDWYWGLNLGRCDGTGAPKDATDVIERLNSVNLITPGPNPNGYYYYLDQDTWEVDPGQVVLPSGSNPFGFPDHELFIGPDNTCMNNVMINYYYNYFKTFGSRFTPAGYQYIVTTMESGIINDLGNSGYHYARVKYGTLHFSNRNEPID